MVCDAKLHTILWRVMSMKLNIGKKTAGLEMTLNREKISSTIFSKQFSKLTEVMSKGELHYLQ